MKTDKYILACGDSFTDRDFKSVEYLDYDCSYKKWPELLANKLDTDVINLGRCGVDNDYIIETAIDHILDHHDKIQLVVIGLSEAWRWSPFRHFLINPIVQAKENLSIRKWHDYEEKHYEVSNWLMVDKLLNIKEYKLYSQIIFKHYFKQIVRIQKLCKNFNLDLIITSLLGPLSYGGLWDVAKNKNLEIEYSSINLAESFMNTPGFYDVDAKAFLGWPCYDQLGGYGLTEVSGGFDFNTMRVGPTDGHPNKLGHEHIAENIYDFYAKAYL